jgi:hypothetical protein
MIANVSRAGEPENHVYTCAAASLRTALSHFYYFCIFNGFVCALFCCAARRHAKETPKTNACVAIFFRGHKADLAARDDKISHVHENNYMRERERDRRACSGVWRREIKPNCRGYISKNQLPDALFAVWKINMQIALAMWVDTNTQTAKKLPGLVIFWQTSIQLP